MSLFNKIFSVFSRTRSNVSANSNVVVSEGNSGNNSLSTLKVVELRAMARTMGLSGYSSMRKNDLVDYIEQNQS